MDEHGSFLCIGGFRHDFGKHNFLDNFTDSRGVFLSSSTKEIWSLLIEGKSYRHFKILTIDKNPLDNDAKKKHSQNVSVSYSGAKPAKKDFKKRICGTW